MNKYFHILSVGSLCLSLGLAGCNQEWDDHYDEVETKATEGVEIYRGTAAEYLSQQSDLSAIQALYKEAGLLGLAEQEDGCTMVVCSNSVLGQAGSVTSDSLFAANLISDLVVPPTSLVEGFGLYMQSGKNLWVTVDALGNTYLNGQKIVRTVLTSSGYIYYVENVIEVQPSIYEYIQGLGDDYSLFKELIAEFEEAYFDADASIPNGVDSMGNTTYSVSVYATKNSLMDRYTENGLPMWDMRSESYQSTLFIPNNALLRKAYETALDSVPLFMNRGVTANDSLKFRKWILESCFVDRKLDPADVTVSGSQFACVGGYIQEIDETTDKETYTQIDAAQWNPAVQHVDADHPVSLSNGVAYLLTDYYKIPNHVVISRVKEKFYNVWAALGSDQQGVTAAGLPVEGGYFRWNHWIVPMVINDCQGSFELSSTLPTMYYHELTAVPDVEARDGHLPVSVDFDGVLYNTTEKDYGLKEVYLPAGEYNLRMGFKHSLEYSLSIYFCGADEEFSDDNCLVRDMGMRATGSNFHFDRAGASEGLELYGDDASGYPEGFDWRWWYNQDPDLYQKASAYDTDGYQVATVTLRKPGNFKIRIESSDNAEFYQNVYGNSLDASLRTKSNVQQLMMYHWCLRPTKNNY
ncbi:MAG: hypothetical protein IJP70_09975 [Bacteroidales bacterium]|nr:hypothetical protein [Bacteroidales bacterium]